MNARAPILVVMLAGALGCQIIAGIDDRQAAPLESFHGAAGGARPATGGAGGIGASGGAGGSRDSGVGGADAEPPDVVSPGDAEVEAADADGAGPDVVEDAADGAVEDVATDASQDDAPADSADEGEGAPDEAAADGGAE